MDLKHLNRALRVDWMHVAEDRVKWRALLSTATNIRVPQKEANIMTC